MKRRRSYLTKYGLKRKRPGWVDGNAGFRIVRKYYNDDESMAKDFEECSYDLGEDMHKTYLEREMHELSLCFWSADFIEWSNEVTAIFRDGKLSRSKCVFNLGSLLLEASSKGSCCPVELLLWFKVQVDHLDEQTQQTALHVASRFGHGAVVKLLLQAKADVLSSDDCGRHALHHASGSAHSGVVKELLNGRAAVNERDNGGHTALSIAFSRGDPTVTRLLLDGKNLDDIRKAVQEGCCLVGDVATTVAEYSIVPG
jgi:hypothetical protein